MGTAEFEFHQLIEICRELHAFEWHLDGKMVKTKVKVATTDTFGNPIEADEEIERFELTAAKKSWFGKLFSDQYGGTSFVLSDGRRVRFGKHGANRQRRYTIQVLDS